MPRTRRPGGVAVGFGLGIVWLGVVLPLSLAVFSEFCDGGPCLDRGYWLALLAIFGAIFVGRGLMIIWAGYRHRGRGAVPDRKPVDDPSTSSVHQPLTPAEKGAISYAAWGGFAAGILAILIVVFGGGLVALSLLAAVTMPFLVSGDLAVKSLVLVFPFGPAGLGVLIVMAGRAAYTVGARGFKGNKNSVYT